MAEVPLDLGAVPLLWVCAGRKLSGLYSPHFFPLFRAPKRNPPNNIEGQCDLTLGGCRLNDTHSNQTQDGFHVTVDVEEDMLPGRSVWRDVVSLLKAANSTTTKSWKLKYVVALVGCRSIIFTQQPTKNMQTWRRRHRGRGSTRGGMHGGMKSLRGGRKQK